MVTVTESSDACQQRLREWDAAWYTDEKPGGTASRMIWTVSAWLMKMHRMKMITK